MTALPRSLIAPKDGQRSKLGKVVAMLAGSTDGEVVAAANAIVRMLKAEGCDIHDLVRHVETVGQAPQRPPPPPQPPPKPDYSADRYREPPPSSGGLGPKPRTFEEVATFMWKHLEFVDEKHHRFIEKMFALATMMRDPTEKQALYLKGLFDKLLIDPAFVRYAKNLKRETNHG